MSKPLFVLLILLVFLLAACNAAEQIPAAETPVPEEDSQLVDAVPTKTEAADQPPTEEPATATATTESLDSKSGAGESPADVKMECTLVSSQPEAPSEYAAIFGVTENDWIEGPDSAALTIVEYGDFQ